MKISIIGIGRLGGALAIALAKNGFEIENLFARKNQNGAKAFEFISSKILTDNEFDQISSDILFITTQDSEIENVAKNLAENLQNSAVVFHTSGSQSSEKLQCLQEIGCKIGSIHPLVSISDAVLGSERFKDSYFCVEGDKEAVKIANEIVIKLGGKPFSIETKFKTLYHASAVTACGHLVALIDVAIEMLDKCGMSENSSKEILLPLIKSTVENLASQTTANALTGTFARADVETFEKHLEVLRANVSTEALEIYLQLGNRSLHLAEEQNANKENLEKIREKISLAKKNLK